MRLPLYALTILLAALHQTCWAQYSTITSPFNSASNSYFEQIGVEFNLTGRNFFFQQNSFGQAAPPFGGFVPGAGASLGFNFRGDGFNGSLGIAASQGSRTSLVGQAPSVTLANGATGGVFDTTISPFVISVIPVVNDDPAEHADAPPTPLAERLQRIQSGEQPARPSSPGNSPATSRPAASGDRWQQRLSASQTAGTAPKLSVAEIRRRKAAQSGSKP